MKYKLKEICNGITDGSHNPPPGGEMSDFPMISSKNISDDCITTDDPRYLTKAQFEIENKRTSIVPGDVLMTIVGTVGRTAVVPENAPNITLQRSVAVLHPNRELCSSRYLMYQLRSKRNYFETEAHGVAQKGLYLKQLSDVSIELHETNQQKEIVDTLDSVNSIIGLRESELVRLDELIKARFVELFGDPIQNPYDWEKKRFDEICENLDSRRKPITSSDRVDGIYPYYGASGIVDYVEDYIFDEDILLVSEDGANLLMRSTPIAFSVSGKVWVNNHAHVVRFDKMCLQKYIEIFFSLIDISDSITGSAQPKLNQAKLNAMEFPIPNESLLEEYLRFLKQVDKSKSAVQKSLDEAQLLFDSLMQQYFG